MEKRKTWLRKIKGALPVVVAISLAWSAKGHAGEIRVTVPVGSVTVIRDSDGFARFYGDDLQFLGASGQPRLPYRIVRVLIPANSDPARITASIKDEILEPLEGKWEIRPIPPLAVSERELFWPRGSRIDDAGRDVQIYDTDAGFPESMIGRVQTGRMRRWILAEIPVALYRYHPASKRLDRLCAGRIVVEYETRLRSGFSEPAATPIPDPIGEEAVRRMTVNFDQVSSTYQTGVSGKKTALGSESGPPKRGYAIITTREIAEGSLQFQTFVESKQRRGFAVQVITEETWGGGIGDEAAENIRGWLKKNYLQLNLEYVLLLGNPDPRFGDVPMKMLWPRFSAAVYRESPSDFYYADLTGNWDLDGDGYFGESDDDFGPGGVDRNWEVLVGRIPYYGDMAALDHILEKIVTYENSPRDRSGWRRRVLLAMKPSDEITPGYHLGEAIKENVIVPKGWEFHRVYEEDFDLEPPPETKPVTVETVSSVWASSPFGAAFWWTHGSPTAAAGVMSVDATGLLDDQHPGIVFQASCKNAYPEVQDNLSFSLLKNGVVAAVGATRVSWYYPGQTVFSGSASNSGMAYEFARRLIGEEMDAGHALCDLRQTLAFQKDLWMNATVFNLYGDPSLGLATAAEPDPLAGFALYADRWIRLERIAPSSGNVGSNGEIVFKAGQSGELSGDVQALGPIRNAGEILIHGDIATNATVNDAGSLNVTGRIIEGGSLLPVAIPTPALQVKADAGDVSVPNRGSMLLAPAQYREVQVGRSATLSLCSGQYIIKNLTLRQGSRLWVKHGRGPIVLAIWGRVVFQSGSAVELEKVENSKDLTIYALQNRPVQIGRSAAIRGTLIAPRAKVRFNKASELHGACYADRIFVGPKARFSSHRPYGEHVVPSKPHK